VAAAAALQPSLRLFLMDQGRPPPPALLLLPHPSRPGTLHPLCTQGPAKGVHQGRAVAVSVAVQVPEGGATPGHSVQAVVLDLSKKDGIMDLSLVPALLELSAQASGGEGQAKGDKGGKKKRRKTEQGAAEASGAGTGAPLQQDQVLECRVQLVGRLALLFSPFQAASLSPIFQVASLCSML
jgi:hypothetical protein